MQTFAPPPEIAWNAHGIEPSVPVRRLEDASWLAGLGLILGLVGIYLLLHHPPFWAFARWLTTAPAALVIAWLPACVCAALLGALGLSAHDRIRHVAGPRLWEGAPGRARARAWARRVGGQDGRDASLASGVPLPSTIWNRHALIFGSVGSGKTQILAHLVRQVAAQPRARMLLADAKGDWTALLPDAALICPWDARSVVWDIQRDVRSLPAAAGFAQALVPDGDPRNRFWVESSRACVEGAVRCLMAEGQPWGWGDLHDVLRLDAQRMNARIAPHHPQVAQVLAGSESTVATVLSSLAADTRVLDVLALAWRERRGEPWSVARWLRANTPLPRRVVVQAGADRSASQQLLGLIITLTACRMLAPATPETSSTRLWVVLDELTAAGQLHDLPALIERGRSKGVALLAGVQDLEQIAALYGRETANSLASMVGLQVVTQVGPGPTRDRLADLIGKRRIAVPSLTQQGEGINPQRATHGLHEETRALVLPAQLSSCLGPWRKRRHAGVRAIVLPTGADAYVLDWPIVPLATRRRAHEPAAWTLHRPGAIAAPQSDAAAAPAMPVVGVLAAHGSSSLAPTPEALFGPPLERER
ncbi:MAG: type IV secretion system DNA-binding domain-containing protein [Vulcanimicrobiaceae bacterium]